MLALAGPRETRAEDPGWLEPIRVAYQRLDKKFATFAVKGSVFQKTDRAGAPAEERKLDHSFAFLRRANCLKTVHPNEKTCAAVNDRYFFFVKENEDGKSHSLLDLGQRQPFSIAKASESPSLNMVLGDGKKSLQMFGFPIEPAYEVLRNNAGHLTAEIIEEGGREFLLLKGDFAPFSNVAGLPAQMQGAITKGNSRILLDPALDYRIVKWESADMSNGKLYDTTEVIEYNETVNGVAVPTKWHMKSGTPSIGYQISEIELTNWQFEVSSDSEFYLSYFGIKEPSFATSFISGWMRLLLIGVALIAVGFWLHRRTTRHAA